MENDCKYAAISIMRVACADTAKNIVDEWQATIYLLKNFPRRVNRSPLL